MVATHDVGERALRLLLELDFRGKNVVEFHGPEVLTMETIAQKIGKELGRPFGVEREPYAANIEAVIAAGYNRDFATRMNDSWETFNTHGLLRSDEPSAENRGTTPIDSFIRNEYRPAYRAITKS